MGLWVTMMRALGPNVVYGIDMDQGGSVQQVFSISSTPVVAKEHVSADLAGEVVIVNLSNGVYYGLEGVGYRVWDLIQKPITIESLRDVLAEEYDVNPRRLESDLMTFFQTLESEGLVSIE